MSRRLDQERQKELEPKRMEYAMERLGEMGIFAIPENDGELRFEWNEATVTLWAYSGWWSGHGVGSGRGIKNLIERLKKIPKQEASPKCHCGGKMVKRKNSITKEPFYGCSNFPKCRNTKPIKK